MGEDEIRGVEDNLDPEPRPARARDGNGLPWTGILLLIWAVALIIFSVQNAERTTVEFLGWAWDMPVALLVMVTALVTLVISSLASSVYRRRRRKRLETTRAPESDR